MKVYIVFSRYKYEEPVFEEIFNSLEKAQSYSNEQADRYKLKKIDDNYYYDGTLEIYIEEREVK